MVQPGRPPMTRRRPTACWTTKDTHTHTRAQTRTRTNAHTRARAHTHTHTHKEYAIAFPRQWLHERVSILRYTHITYLVIAKLVFTEWYELDV